MKNTLKALLLGIIVSFGTIVAGCDSSADVELKRAETSLNEALAIGADASASDDYQKAEEMLIRAQELARDNKILEARQVAVEAKMIADDAKRKAEERQRILEEEATRLGK